jgi:uncharacterized phiE125 gp8 family phage protein
VVTLEYNFSATTTAPPTTSQVRLNAAFPYSTVTKFWLSLITTDTRDVYVLLLKMPLGATLYLQDKNDHTRFVRCHLAGTPIDQTTFVEWPVVWESSGGVAFGANQVLELYCLEPAATAAAAPPVGSAGVTWTDEGTGTHTVSIVEIAPTVPVLTTDEVKLYARLAGVDLDPLLPTFLDAARIKVETDSGQALLTQTRRVWFDRVPYPTITLPPGCWPLQSVEVNYLTTSNAVVVVDPATYLVDAVSQPPRLHFTSGLGGANMRAFQPLTARVVAGASSAAAIQAPLRHAVGLLAGFYANESGDRFLAQDLWDQYEDTIAPYRLLFIA